MYDTFIKTFTTREIAYFVWLVIFISWIIWEKSIPFNELKNFILATTVKSLLEVYVFILTYSFVVCFVMYKMQIWNLERVKVFIVWFIGAGLPLCFSRALNKKKYTKLLNVIISNIKLLVIIQFIVNMYAFNFIIEFILVPITTILLIIQILSEYYDEFKIFEIPSDIILGIIVIIMFIFSFKEAIENYNDFTYIDSIISFILPLTMSIIYFPVAYILGVYSIYQDIYLRANFRKEIPEEEKKWRKQLIFKACKFSYRRLMQFQDSYVRQIIINPSRQNFEKIMEAFNKGELVE